MNYMFITELIHSTHNLLLKVATYNFCHSSMSYILVIRATDNYKRNNLQNAIGEKERKKNRQNLSEDLSLKDRTGVINQRVKTCQDIGVSFAFLYLRRQHYKGQLVTSLQAAMCLIF